MMGSDKRNAGDCRHCFACEWRHRDAYRVRDSTLGARGKSRHPECVLGRLHPPVEANTQCACCSAASRA